MLMPSAKTVSLALAALITGAAGGYWMGRDHGALEVQAATDSQTVASFTSLLEQHAQQVREANAASERLNRLIAQRQTHNDSTTQTLKEVLHETAALRADCRFDDRVMRELTDARNRAAKAAASGLDGTVPTTD